METVRKAPCDRALLFKFDGGRGLAIELLPNGANLVALGEHGSVQAALRTSKSDRARLTPGRPWSARALPPGRDDPFNASAEEIDAAVSEAETGGESAAGALCRRFMGLGKIAAELVFEEHRATRTSIGSIVRARLDAITRGRSEIVVEEGEAGRLLPWRPAWEGAKRVVEPSGGAAATVAHYHEARAEAARLRSRIDALGAILQHELDRTGRAERRVREGLKSFEDPERFGRMGEALLAGLGAARRIGEAVVVPDPYDERGGEVLIPAPPDRSLPQLADDLFQRQRRARRGLDAATARAEALAQQSTRLHELVSAHQRVAEFAGIESLEAEMRRAGIPVGLSQPTRRARAASRLLPPELHGVRILSSSDGWTILVGRTARDNDRLTFKIAGSEDFWLHAAGVTGAHVVIRNPERRGAPPNATLAEAARFALWFSDARSHAAAEVHWTRRKYVRRARGGPPGLVVLKRFETIRVRPAPPPDGV